MVLSNPQALAIDRDGTIYIADIGDKKSSRQMISVYTVPEPAKLYTWWSYRAPDWAAVDKGRRLDHIWVSPELGDRFRGSDTGRRGTSRTCRQLSIPNGSVHMDAG